MGYNMSMNKNRFDKQVKVVDDILVKSSQVKSSFYMPH